MTHLTASQAAQYPNARRIVKRESSLEAGRPSRKGRIQANDAKQDSGALAVLCLVIVFLSCMILTVRSLPSMSSIERENEKFIWRPSTAAHFQRDKELLLRYREVHAWRLFVGMSLLYIVRSFGNLRLCRGLFYYGCLCRVQTFCIPGSGTTLNILAGCVFHDLVPHGEFLIALPFAVLCTTAGAMSCYLVSYSTAREVIMRRFPGRVSWLRQKVSEQNSSFFFLL